MATRTPTRSLPGHTMPCEERRRRSDTAAPFRGAFHDEPIFDWPLKRDHYKRSETNIDTTGGLAMTRPNRQTGVTVAAVLLVGVIATPALMGVGLLWSCRLRNVHAPVDRGALDDLPVPWTSARLAATRHR